MYFGKITILLFIAVCVSINAVAIKRKTTKTKIKKTNLPNIVSPKCGCQNPIFDILNTGMGPAIEPLLGALEAFEIGIPGCRGPVIEPLGTLAPLSVTYPGYRAPIVEPFAPIETAFTVRQSPVIDIPNYRYAEPLELNSLGCLFPSIEIPSFGFLPPPMTLPSVEYFNTVDLPCGCPGPQCGCRAPAVKLPACPREYLAPEVPNCGCLQGIPAYNSYGAITSVIELPSYPPAPVMPAFSACGCQGPCSCSGIPVPPCGCQGPCSCPGIPVSLCGCQGPCSCPGIPISTCGCKGPCTCPEYQILSCGCQGSCSCPAIPASPCGCIGPCGCGSVPVSCGCQGPCSCSGIQVTTGLLPGIEVPSCGCGCGFPGCSCGQYLRQVTLQPPFL